MFDSTAFASAVSAVAGGATASTSSSSGALVGQSNEPTELALVTDSSKAFKNEPLADILPSFPQASSNGLYCYSSNVGYSNQFSFDGSSNYSPYGMATASHPSLGSSSQSSYYFQSNTHSSPYAAAAMHYQGILPTAQQQSLGQLPGVASLNSDIGGNEFFSPLATNSTAIDSTRLEQINGATRLNKGGKSRGNSSKMAINIKQEKRRLENDSTDPSEQHLSSGNGSGKKRKRKRRVLFSKAQTYALERSLGPKVKIWFQNHRYKTKKTVPGGKDSTVSANFLQATAAAMNDVVTNAAVAALSAHHRQRGIAAAGTSAFTSSSLSAGPTDGTASSAAQFGTANYYGYNGYAWP
uniref:Homeobox domain-containing protein n=1 Tax=Ditylenchus dipsaci TaxID=166011 RepID=A0A915D4P2_9BILA